MNNYNNNKLKNIEDFDLDILINFLLRNKKFISEYPSSDISKFIVELEQAEHSIGLNLNMPLVLVNMLINIQGILKN